MPAKFVAISADPFLNNTNEFVLIVSIDDYSVPSPSAPETSSTGNGILENENGAVYGYMFLAFCQDYVVTGSLSNEAFAHSWTHDQKTILVPPGFKFKSFGLAIGIQGTLEELAPFIRGM